jgi:hypothetical protein
MKISSLLLAAIVIAIPLSVSFGNENECGAFGASALDSDWNWHFPRETPTVRNGAKHLSCMTGRTGWLYTRADIAGRYFVASEDFAMATEIHLSPCTAVAEYCSKPQ